jgi:fructose-bisphosphate aldolase, class II
MTTVPTGDLVNAARSNGRGIAAFNVITLEYAEAIVAGAERTGLPVILQVSENAVRFHGGRVGHLAAALRGVAADAAVSVGLHLDHVESVTLLRQAPEHGFSSVMFDASTLPYDENVTATKAAAEFVHGHGLWMEAELGMVGGKEGHPPLPPHDPGARTDPDQAASYVAATGVDALAIAVGSTHAMAIRDATLDHQLIAALRDAVPVPLVLHGSSGVPDAQLRAAVCHGIVKVNIGTALNVAFTSAVRQILGTDPSVVDPRKYVWPARDAMAETVAHFLTVLADAQAVVA